MQLSIIDKRNSMGWINLRFNSFPSRPLVIDQVKCPVKIGWRIVMGMGNHMQQIHIVFFLMISTCDFKISHLIKFLNVPLKGCLRMFIGHVLREQIVFKFLEKGWFIMAQFGFNPVFRIEKNLTVGFPDPIIFHPFPAVFYIRIWQSNSDIGFYI